jgi:hypothetical protein
MLQLLAIELDFSHGAHPLMENVKNQILRSFSSNLLHRAEMTGVAPLGRRGDIFCLTFNQRTI